MDALAQLPTGAKAALALLVVVQVTLDVVALLRLWRTPPERLQFGARWPWLLIILLVNLVGAIVFLAVGRKPPPAADPASKPAAEPADPARALDALYGPRTPTDDR